MNTSRLTLIPSVSLLALALFGPMSARADVIGSAYLDNSAIIAVNESAHGAAHAAFSVPSADFAACAGDSDCLFSTARLKGRAFGKYHERGHARIHAESSAASSDVDDDATSDSPTTVTSAVGMGGGISSAGGAGMQAGTGGGAQSAGGVGTQTSIGGGAQSTTGAGTQASIGGGDMPSSVPAAPRDVGPPPATSLDSPTPEVPEPSTLALSAAGLLGLAWVMRRRRNRT